MPDPGTGLRARLIDAGVGLVATEGVRSLTPREIARRAGVSHGAPRRRFPTHPELLSAMACRGFTDLATRAAEAVGDGSTAPREQLTALGHAYQDFALTHRVYTS